MLDKIKKVLKEIPILNKILILIFRNVINPLISGHLKYYIKYRITIYKQEIIHLKSYGLTEITPYNYKEWRIGKGRDKAYRRYYLAKYGQTKCFIKVGINDATVYNECWFMNKFKNNSFDVFFYFTKICQNEK